MTREQITRAYEKAGRTVEETQQDARHRMLIEAAAAYEQYQRSLRQIEDVVADLRRGAQGQRGIASVDEHVLSSSAFEDLKRAAQKVETIRRLLHWLPLPEEQPVADLIRTFVERKPIGEEV